MHAVLLVTVVPVQKHGLSEYAAQTQTRLRVRSDAAGMGPQPRVLRAYSGTLAAPQSQSVQTQPWEWVLVGLQGPWSGR